VALLAGVAVFAGPAACRKTDAPVPATAESLEAVAQEKCSQERWIPGTPRSSLFELCMKLELIHDVISGRAGTAVAALTLGIDKEGDPVRSPKEYAAIYMQQYKQTLAAIAAVPAAGKQ
jgi:hypothetical protein